jgi:hypothetical protein
MATEALGKLASLYEGKTPRVSIRPATVEVISHFDRRRLKFVSDVRSISALRSRRMTQRIPFFLASCSSGPSCENDEVAEMYARAL